MPCSSLTNLSVQLEIVLKRTMTCRNGEPLSIRSTPRGSAVFMNSRQEPREREQVKAGGTLFWRCCRKFTEYGPPEPLADGTRRGGNAEAPRLSLDEFTSEKSWLVMALFGISSRY